MDNKKQSLKQQRNTNRHKFLLTLFDDDKQEYAVKEINGFILVRQKSPVRWEVAIYPKENWAKRAF